jgi:hypothetical protein
MISFFSAKFYSFQCICLISLSNLLQSILSLLMLVINIFFFCGPGLNSGPQVCKVLDAFVCRIAFYLTFGLFIVNI